MRDKWIRIISAFLVGAAHLGCGQPIPDCDSSQCTADASTGSGDVVLSTETETPHLRGAYTRVYRPSGTRYLNDHTVVRGRDGRWHVYGITHESEGMPFAERSLLHASAPALQGPWSDEPDILMAQGGEQALWAPYAFEDSPGHWVMYFYASTPDRRVQRADSSDLRRWTRSTWTAPGGRDPFVLRVGQRWLLYSVGVSAESRGQILVTESTDLEHWGPVTVALEDPVPSFGWGNLESPTVVFRSGIYYLFVTQTSESPIDYVRTVVVASTEPTRFTWSPVTEIFSHAAEVVMDGDAMFLTSAGWTSEVGERWRGLSIAPLGWSR